MGFLRASTLAAVLIVAGACAPAFERDDGIAALENGGMSNAEATCVANRLHAVQQIEILDPANEVRDDDRALLVSATRRCVELAEVNEDVPTEVLSEADLRIYEDDYEEDAERQAGVESLEADLEDVSLEIGRQRLRLLGRSDAFIDCVIDHLRSVDAIELLQDEQLGMGLDPVEADAYAACI